MNIHYLQHVPYESIGAIEHWAADRGHELSGTQLYGAPPWTPEFPEPGGIDLLVVMGGPMNVYEH